MRRTENAGSVWTAVWKTGQSDETDSEEVFLTDPGHCGVVLVIAFAAVSAYNFSSSDDCCCCCCCYCSLRHLVGNVPAGSSLGHDHGHGLDP